MMAPPPQRATSFSALYAPLEFPDGDVAGASGAWDASEMLSCTRTWGGGVLAVGLPFESSFFSCFLASYYMNHISCSLGKGIIEGESTSSKADVTQPPNVCNTTCSRVESSLDLETNFPNFIQKYCRTGLSNFRLSEATFL